MSKNKNKKAKNSLTKGVDLLTKQAQLTAGNSLAEALRISDYDCCNSSLGYVGAYQNINYQLITLQQILITFLYKTYGVLAKGVDIPVDDAFKGGGFDLEADTLDENEMLELKKEIYKRNDIEQLKKAMRWCRLFGGAAIICNDGGALNEPLDYENLKYRNVEFIPVDRWQLSYSETNVNIPGGTWEWVPQKGQLTQGFNIHPSRIKIINGKDMSYIVNQMTQGWGVSIFEQVFQDINIFFKGRNALFEFIDEAKIDVLKLSTLQTALMSGQGEKAVQRMVDLIARNKNNKSTITMSTEDEYEQKQLTFSGVAEISKEIRIMLSSSLEIPVAKMWGEGVTGFGSGEDSLENYNSMIEASVREPANQVIDWMLEIRCFNLFGRAVADLTKIWKNLRVLSAIDEQNINDHKLANVMQLFDRKLLTPQEAMEYLKKQQIFIHDTKALRGELEDMPLWQDQQELTEFRDITK